MSEGRLKELDVLRGFAVAVMILVVSPGSWEYRYGPLQHANWHGWTFADLVFPDFLFGVGMALGLTFGRSLDPRRDPSGFRWKVLRRVIGLTALGLLLNFFFVLAGWIGSGFAGPLDLTGWRLPGVLQRIALCYLIAVLIVSTAVLPIWRSRVPIERRAAIAAGSGAVVILVAYWAMLTFIPAPGYEAGDLSKAGNLPAWIDRAVFTPDHMWEMGFETSWGGPIVFDPEGLLSTLPATANVLFGFVAIAIWRAFPGKRAMALLGMGLAFVLAGLLMDAVFPINKQLWTSSFALFTVGVSFLALVLAALLLRSGLAEKALFPFVVLGGNALLAFTLSGALSAFGAIAIHDGLNAQALGFAWASRFIADPYVASLACALGILALIVAVLLPLHRKGIHLRV